MADRLRANQGKDENATLHQMMAEQAAIANALSQHNFQHAAATVYIAEMTALHSPISMDEAHVEINSIFVNRIRDCHGFVALLGQPEFIAAARAEAAQPKAPHTPYRLPPEKVEEAITRLVQSNDPHGAEPAVHVAASARGQQVTHQALANLFRPSGALKGALIDALATAWPQATGAELQQIAGHWLKARHDPAHETAKGMAPDGEIFKEAMRRAVIIQEAASTAIGKAKTTASQDTSLADTAAAIAKAQASAIAAAPNPSIAGPAQHNGMVVQPELMVDRL